MQYKRVVFCSHDLTNESWYCLTQGVFCYCLIRIMSSPPSGCKAVAIWYIGAYIIIFQWYYNYSY